MDFQNKKVFNSTLRKWVFTTNSNFCIPLSLQLDVVDTWYFKLWFLLDLSLKYQMFRSSGCNDIRISKLEFVTKTQFLYFRQISSNTPGPCTAPVPHPRPSINPLPNFSSKFTKHLSQFTKFIQIFPHYLKLSFPPLQWSSFNPVVQPIPPQLPILTQWN